MLAPHFNGFWISWFRAPAGFVLELLPLPGLCSAGAIIHFEFAMAATCLEADFPALLRSVLGPTVSYECQSHDLKSRYGDVTIQ